MATAPKSSTIEDFDEQSRVHGGNQNLREKAIPEVEKIDTTEPDFEHERNRINRTDVGSLTKSMIIGHSIDIMQPKIEHKNDMNDTSAAGSNPEQTEENQVDSVKDRLSFRLGTPTLFEKATSSDAEKPKKEQCQQIMTDSCKNTGKEMEDRRDKPDAKQMIVHMQTECRVSKENQLDKSVSNRCRDSKSTSSNKEEKDQIEQKSAKQDDKNKYDLYSHLVSVNYTDEVYINDSSKGSCVQEVPSGNAEGLKTKRKEDRKKEPAAEINDIDATSSTIMDKVIQNEVHSTTFFDPPKAINNVKKQNVSSKANSISSDRQSKPGSRKDWNENDSISSKQSLLVNNNPEQLSLSQSIPVILSRNSDKLIDSNDLQLDDLKVLLQHNPSSSSSQATPSVKDCRKSELECLEDLLCSSTPSRKQSSASIAQKNNDEVQTETDQNAGLKCLEDLLHGSTPSRISSKVSIDDHVSNQNDKVKADKGQNPDLKYLEDLLLNHTPTIIQSDANLDPNISNENDDMNRELQGLEDLLNDSTPSETKPNITFYDEGLLCDAMQTDVDENTKFEYLDNSSLDSTSPRIQLNASSDDDASKKGDEIKTKKDDDPESKYRNGLLLDSTPSRIQSDAHSDDHVLNKNAEIRAGTKMPFLSRSSIVESALSEKVVLTMNSTTGLPEPSHPFLPPNLLSDYAASMRDSTTISPHRYQSTDNMKTPTSTSQQKIEEFNDEGQLSVFSDATSGQNYIRHVSNAKKQLKRIEDEMKQLNGINDDDKGMIVDNNNNCGDDRSAIRPSERHRANEKGMHSQIAKKFIKSNEQKERGIEPPTRKQESSGRSASSDEIPRKVRRKASKKKQVRPEKGTRKESMDPIGKDIHRQKYSHREIKRGVSPPSSSRRMERGDSPTRKNAVNKERNPNDNDPPMIMRGRLEVEGSPTDWNDDHLSLEYKSKRKKKDKKNRSQDGSESRNRDGGQSKYKERFQNELETNLNSVVSSHMERGVEGWSLPIDEVDANNRIPEKNVVEDAQGFDRVPRQVDTKKSNHHPQRDDPWEEVPCSCCCRYLPHKLVVATTHAYRLDRADQKEHELMDFKL